MSKGTGRRSLCVVWLPIALTCRICHSTRYQDTCRTLLYHYLLTIAPIFFEAQHWTHHCHTIATLTDSLPHTGTITATPELLPHDARLQNMIPTLFPLSPDTDRPVLVILADCSICMAQLWDLQFHMAATGRSGPSESTLTQDRDRSSPPWFAHPSAIEYRSSQYWSFSHTSRHSIRTVIPLAIIGLTVPAGWI
jgi:hypothetical protein